jgi:UrcA family protein
MTLSAKSLTACFAITLAFASTASEAREQALISNADQELTTIVVYGDLNLDNADGAKTLERRVRRAVERVCQAPNGKVPVSEIRQFRTCRQQATEGAMASIRANAESNTRVAVR